MKDLFLYVVTKHGTVLRKAVIGYHYIWALQEESPSLDTVLALAHQGRDDFKFSEAALKYCRSHLDFKRLCGAHILIQVDGKVVCAEGPDDRFLVEPQITELL